MEIVRINLHAVQDGTDKYLKVLVEIMTDGRVVHRNQKLAVVVRAGETWQDSVTSCFTDKFGLSPELQDKILTYEGNWWKEESLVSPSIPGITTRYMTHEVSHRRDERRVGFWSPGIARHGKLHDYESGCKEGALDVVCHGFGQCPRGPSPVEMKVIACAVESSPLVSLASFRRLHFSPCLCLTFDSRLLTLLFLWSVPSFLPLLSAVPPFLSSFLLTFLPHSPFLFLFLSSCQHTPRHPASTQLLLSHVTSPTHSRWPKISTQNRSSVSHGSGALVQQLAAR